MVAIDHQHWNIYAPEVLREARHGYSHRDYISDPGESPLRSGDFRTMRIVEAHDYELTGELIDAPMPREEQLFQIA